MEPKQKWLDHSPIDVLNMICNGMWFESVWLHGTFYFDINLLADALFCCEYHYDEQAHSFRVASSILSSSYGLYVVVSDLSIVYVGFLPGSPSPKDGLETTYSPQL